MLLLHCYCHTVFIAMLLRWCCNGVAMSLPRTLRAWMHDDCRSQRRPSSQQFARRSHPHHRPHCPSSHCPAASQGSVAAMVGAMLPADIFTYEQAWETRRSNQIVAVKKAHGFLHQHRASLTEVVHPGEGGVWGSPRKSSTSRTASICYCYVIALALQCYCHDIAMLLECYAML